MSSQNIPTGTGSEVDIVWKEFGNYRRDFSAYEGFCSAVTQDPIVHNLRFRSRGMKRIGSNWTIASEFTRFGRILTRGNETPVALTQKGEEHDALPS
ncbi:hypothetical protein SERLA73DRAFT_189164, partial [Serpula lacrymans var. lacrymans S7.3]